MTVGFYPVGGRVYFTYGFHQDLERRWKLMENKSLFISGIESISFAPTHRRVKVKNKSNLYSRPFYTYKWIEIPLVFNKMHSKYLGNPTITVQEAISIENPNTYEPCI
jgi:hypothetical protein